MIYYTIVTLSTAGFGDISPQSEVGQILFVLFWVSFVFVISTRSTELFKMLGLTSPYEISYKGSDQRKHILLLGDSSPEAIRTFFTEYFHSDHGQSETDIVLCQDRDPTPEISLIIKSPQFDSKITYIKGDPLQPESLERCLAHKATCCVIMSNQMLSSGTTQQEDYKNILSAFAVKKFTCNNSKKKGYAGIPICLQINKPEHKDLYYSGQ